MKPTETLIAELAQNNPAARQALSPLSLTMLWLGGAALYGAALVGLHFSLRPDITAKLADGWFIAEIVTLTLVVIAAAIAANFLAYPDLYQQKNIVRLPIAGFALFLVVLGLEAAFAPFAPPPAEGMECCAVIAALALPPGAALFTLIRRMATVHPAQAGCTATLAAFGVGALTLRLSELTDSIAHLMTWHYVPMLAVAGLGLWLGQKFLKW